MILEEWTLKHKTVCYFIVVTLIFLAGCAPFPVVHVQEPPLLARDKVNFVDRRVATDQAGFMFGEGLITSCHYAIERTKDTILDPDSMALLHAYLSNQVFTDGEPHTMVVSRFEIYINRQATVLHDAWGDIYKPGPLVGCEGAEQGEYLLAEIPQSPRPAPIVIYLNATVDGVEHKVRSLYPFESYADTSVESAHWPDALTAALNNTFAALAADIRK